MSSIRLIFQMNTSCAGLYRPNLPATVLALSYNNMSLRCRVTVDLDSANATKDASVMRTCGSQARERYFKQTET